MLRASLSNAPASQSGAFLLHPYVSPHALPHALPRPANGQRCPCCQIHRVCPLGLPGHIFPKCTRDTKCLNEPQAWPRSSLWSPTIANVKELLEQQTTRVHTKKLSTDCFSFCTQQAISAAFLFVRQTRTIPRCRLIGSRVRVMSSIELGYRVSVRHHQQGRSRDISELTWRICLCARGVRPATTRHSVVGPAALCRAWRGISSAR